LAGTSKKVPLIGSIVATQHFSKDGSTEVERDQLRDRHDRVEAEEEGG
jgi:hypothetical protein